jgi:hypothetical protein
MREHIRIVGILNIIMGCLVAAIGIVGLMILGGLAGFVSVSGNTSDFHDVAVAAPILAMIGVGVAIFFLVLALPSIIGGWGLLNFKPWARILMIVVSALHLFHVPLGTALGIYGLWALLSEEGRRLFEGGSQAYLPGPVPYPAHPVPPSPNYPPQAGS